MAGAQGRKSRVIDYGLAMRRLTLVALLVIGVSVASVAPAGAKKSTACAYLTKQQVSKILGYKVVKTAITTDKASGAEQCEYRTGYFQKDRFKQLDAPYKMKVTTQPLLEKVTKDLATAESDPDSDPVTSLGVRAFYTGGDDLIAVVGDLVLQVEVTNVQWSGNERDTLIRNPELEAMKVLVPLFQSVPTQK